MLRWHDARRRARPAVWLAAVTAVGLAGALTACSSSGGNGAASTSTQSGAGASAGKGGSAAAVATAKQAIANFEAPQTSIGITVPLKAKPPTGKFLIWIAGNLESYQGFTDGYSSAAKALGWKFETLTYDPSSATSAASALQEAISQHPDFIAISGVPYVEYESALKTAMAAHIPLFDGESSNPENPSVDDIQLVVDPPAFNQRQGKLMGNWTVADSNGTAKALLVNVPDYTSLAIQNTAAKQAIAACGTCSVSELDVSIQTLGEGGTPQAVVSYLQAHPDINYLVFELGQMTTGVRTALDSAGIGQNVKIVSQLPLPSNMQAVANGQESMVVTGPNSEASWNSVDGMLRMLEGMSLSPSETALPVWFVTKSDLPNPATTPPAGVSNYQAQFEKLWHVSS